LVRSRNSFTSFAGISMAVFGVLILCLFLNSICAVVLPLLAKRPAPSRLGTGHLSFLPVGFS
jgi:hypothetical protein